MIRLPPRSTRTDTLFPYTTLFLSPKADLVLCPSVAIQRELCERYGVPTERLAVLENPVDVAGVRQAATKVRRHPGAGPRFVAAGRLTVQKAFDRLLGMMAKLPADNHLTILGDGPEINALLRRLAEQTGSA